MIFNQQNLRRVSNLLEPYTIALGCSVHPFRTTQTNLRSITTLAEPLTLQSGSFSIAFFIVIFASSSSIIRISKSGFIRMRSRLSQPTSLFAFPCVGTFTSPGTDIKQKRPTDYSMSRDRHVKCCPRFVAPSVVYMIMEFNYIIMVYYGNVAYYIQTYVHVIWRLELFL